MTDRRRFLQGASVLMAHVAFPEVVASFLVGQPATAHAERAGMFDEPEMRILEGLVDVILPETDSPAASAAGTHVFIDMALSACGTEEQRDVFRSGLRDFSTQGFETADPGRRAALLAERAKADMALPYDRSFFRILKDYTLTGYFHSEVGATRALAYERVPGGYDADVPLRPGQKAWAL